MVEKINDYAQDTTAKAGPLRRKSVMRKWVPITVDEFRKFQAILLHMGNICMPSYRHYWRMDRYFKLEIFRSIMTRDRFEMILRFYHFGDCPAFIGDRLKKVRFLIDHFNEVSHSVFTPDRKLSVDESMMLW